MPLALAAAFLTSGPARAAMRMHMIMGRPVVDEVFVNGHGPYRFLIDTGAELNHLDPTLARSIGIKPDFRSELETPTGVAMVTGAGDLEVAIGQVRARGQAFLFAGMDTVHLLYADVQGVLGQSFLARFDYLLDLRARQIDFGRQERGATMAHTPLRIVNGRPAIATSLGTLVLDSGASDLTLYDVEPRAETHEIITMVGAVKVGMVMRRLSIGGRTVWSGQAIAVPRSSSEAVTGLLPVRLFRAVYVCNSEGFVELE